MGKWMYHRFYDKITRVEVDRCNDKSVWVRGRKRAIESKGEGWYDTWQEAKNVMLRDATKMVEVARKNLEYYLELLKKAEAMCEPASEE